MVKLSTNQVAKRLGLTSASLTRYILAGKVIAPPETMAGGMRMRLWSESEIERLRKALPKIANGRKTRYQKKKSAVRNQQSAKTRRAQAGAPTLQKQKKKK